jgi:hypothetical protein
MGFEPRNGRMVIEKKRTIAFRTGQFRRRIFHTPLVKHFIPGFPANVVRWPGRKPEGERGERTCSGEQFVNAGTNHAGR